MTCRSSLIAARPPDSIASSAWWAISGAVVSTVRAAPACTTITLTLWVTTSCNSWAIRARSRCTASRVSVSRCASTARTRCWRVCTALAASATGIRRKRKISSGWVCGRLSRCPVTISTAPARTLVTAATRYGLYITAPYPTITQAAKVNVASRPLFPWYSSLARTTTQNTARG
jgi:hypothetical protein